MGMLVVLVLLMVLEELAVYVGGIFENIISPNCGCEQFIEYKNKIFCTNKNLKILMTKSKIHFYFRVIHISIPLAICEK